MPLLLLLLSACNDAPVEWSGNSAQPLSAGAVALNASGETYPDSLTLQATALVPPPPACPGSLRVARVGNALVAVWWAPRADSAARLVSARTQDAGRTWSAVSPVDTLDRDVIGCRRAPPSIASDSASGYVHVAYGLVAPEGPGIFFSHSMDSGATFHAPVAIVYGERLGFTSVAASGDLVAVAFDDPNGTATRIGLALSRTMGHIFENRLLPVSGDNSTAARPLVALEGRRFAIAWHEGAGESRDTVLRVRTGTLH